MIPNELREVYSNPPREVFGTPVVIFRDHRWTLPAIACAAKHGLIGLPAVVVTFDRHRDSLIPEHGLEELARWKKDRGGMDALADIVANLLSPRDDDWIVAGMAAGLVSDVLQFRTGDDDLEPVTRFIDNEGVAHRIFHAGTFGRELTYKGMLADDDHPAAREGAWEAVGWDPVSCTVSGGRSLVLDVDLDCFTIAWETYVVPFSPEIWRGEFHAPRSSRYGDAIVPAEVFEGIVRASGIVTVATEPAFCGGKANARRCFERLDRFLFGGVLHGRGIDVDYRPCYPSEET